MINTKICTVSISLNDLEYMKQSRLSPSGIIRDVIKQLRDKENKNGTNTNSN